MQNEEYKDYIRLCEIPDIGNVSAMRLISHFGSPRAALEASRAELMGVEKIGAKTAESILRNRDKIDVEKICARMDALGARYIHYGSPAYPKLLAQIPSPPVGFYAIGSFDFSMPCISIIGSRGCSIYGQTVARRFASAFARAGFGVVSGMARGIDSCAHIGAIEAKGQTAAVLGCGADVIYPPENGELYNRIISSGAIISEFPLGSRADKQNFPIRNRIVSGLSLATLVVESDTRGGSMITARLAAEQGRDVFAIPGRIDLPTSRGCNALIRDGATLATCPEDIIDALAFSGQLELPLAPKEPRQSAPAQNKSAAKIKLSDDEAKLLSCLERLGSADIDSLAELAQTPPHKCLPILTMLEIKKLASKNAGGIWSPRIN